jgi:hypothetical protein
VKPDFAAYGPSYLMEGYLMEGNCKMKKQWPLILLNITTSVGLRIITIILVLFFAITLLIRL